MPEAGPGPGFNLLHIFCKNQFILHSTLFVSRPGFARRTSIPRLLHGRKCK